MKLIIAGGRDMSLTNDMLGEIINGSGFPELFDMVTTKDLEVVSGTATGIDSCGASFAKEFSSGLKEFPAEWDKFGKGAGHIRNKQMADYADALLLIWNGESKGSANMRETMLKQNKPVYEVILRRIK